MVIEYFLEWVQTAPVSKRVSAAGALVRAYLAGSMDQEEREDVEAAITTLTEDPAPSVRLELAECFGAFPSAPRHIMATLVDDSLDVSVTVLSQSPVFHDAELVGYAKRGSEKQQIAVACRPWLSRFVVDELCDFVCRDAAYALLMNPAASFETESLHVLASRFGKDTDIRNMLHDHEALCAETRFLLVHQLGSALGDLIKDRNWMPENKASKVIADANERASIIFTANVDDSDVRAIVSGMIEEGKLTVAYLLRALCMGNITLVAHALSELSGVKISRVENVLNGNREAAFKAIFDRAGLPTAAFGVFTTALSKWRELLNSESAINQSRLPFLVTRELLSAYTSGQSEVVDDLLVLLRKLAAEAARESAKFKASEIAERNAALELVPIEVSEENDTAGLQEPVIDLDQFSENLQIELSQLDLETASDLEQESELHEVGIAEIAANIAESHGATPGNLEEMYSDIYGLTEDEFVDGFSRAA